MLGALSLPHLEKHGDGDQVDEGEQDVAVQEVDSQETVQNEVQESNPRHWSEKLRVEGCERDVECNILSKVVSDLLNGRLEQWSGLPIGSQLVQLLVVVEREAVAEAGLLVRGQDRRLLHHPLVTVAGELLLIVVKMDGLDRVDDAFVHFGNCQALNKASVPSEGGRVASLELSRDPINIRFLEAHLFRGLQEPVIGGTLKSL